MFRWRRGANALREFFFDLEIQQTAAEAGGWDHLSECGISVAVALAADGSEIRIYTPAELAALRALMRGARRVIGYNIVSFDRVVLRGKGITLPESRCLDMMVLLAEATGHRLQLSAFAEATLGVSVGRDGVANVELWKRGRTDRVIENCCNDVITMRRLYQYGREHGRLCVRTGAGQRRRSVRVELPPV